jgi:hypothetical protein
MRNLAIIALCLFSSVVSAEDIEELVVTAKRVRVVIEHISSNHKQNPITGNWHYVETVQVEKPVIDADQIRKDIIEEFQSHFAQDRAIRIALAD